MGGRHRAGTSPPSARQPLIRRRLRRLMRRHRLVVATALFVVLALLAGTGTGTVRGGELLGCLGSGGPLRVAASPDIAPALKEIAGRFSSGDLGAAEGCDDVDVVASEARTVADRLSSGDGGRRPDVWVPDSSIWVERTRDKSPREDLLRVAFSVAHSPVAIAMTRPVAEELGWPDAGLGWGSVFGGTDEDVDVAAGFVDPATSSVSLIGLLALRGAVQDSADANTRLVSAMRSLRSDVVASDNRLLEALPRSRRELTSPEGGQVQAFPYAEQAIWRYNASGPVVPLVAAYPPEGTPVLDYPYAMVSIEDDERAAAARAFLAAVRSVGGRRVIAEHAFRDVAGRAPARIAEQDGLSSQPQEKAYLPTLLQIRQVLHFWQAVNLRGHTLVVVDVSGSMGSAVPAVRATRMGLAKDAARRAVALVSEDSEIGLWVFSTRLDGNRDYREVVASGPLQARVGGSSRKQVLEKALGELAPKRGGGTGLYDTTLAAYRQAWRHYRADELHTVVLLTDGANEDPRSITLERLLDELAATGDPGGQLPITTVAFGPDTDPRALARIAQATGGRSYVSKDPSAIHRVLLDAIVERACTRGCV
ncbi:MAG: substrate-binding domain-containing protein [Carbonactinosporaceae bacterium]